MKHKYLIFFYILIVHFDIINFVLFTNECTSDYIENSIKICIKIAPIRYGADHIIFRELITRAC